MSIVAFKKNFPFAPMAKVLVRSSDDALWYISTFYICIPEQKKSFICESGHYEQAIAYKGNEHLVFTSFSEGYVSVGDRIVYRNYEGCRVWKAREITPDIMALASPSRIEYYSMATHAHLIGTELPANTPAPPKRTLKPFDRVLVRDREWQNWIAAQFSHYEADGEECEYWTTGGWSYTFCIPYEGNENLVGTTG